MSVTNPSRATSVPGQALTHLSTFRLVGKEDSITYLLALWRLLNTNKQINLGRGWTSFTNFLGAISVLVRILVRFRSLASWKSEDIVLRTVSLFGLNLIHILRHHTPHFSIALVIFITVPTHHHVVGINEVLSFPTISQLGGDIINNLDI